MENTHARTHSRMHARTHVPVLAVIVEAVGPHVLAVAVQDGAWSVELGEFCVSDGAILLGCDPKKGQRDHQGWLLDTGRLILLRHRVC